MGYFMYTKPSAFFACLGELVLRSTRISRRSSYARDNATVVLRGISVLDNVVARGSGIFVVDSVLKTYQVRGRCYDIEVRTYIIALFGEKTLQLLLLLSGMLK